MSIERNSEYWVDVVRNLIALPQETEWLEFKTDNKKPKLIGQNISALSNAAALLGEEKAYCLGSERSITHDYWHHL